jgi:hypothetical protein
MTTDMKLFIDRVIVPALVDRFLAQSGWTAPQPQKTTELPKTARAA